MKRNNIVPTVTTPLESVTRQFEHWRLTRKKKEKIPDTLWALAVPLVNQYSQNKIAKALRVNHAQIKEHVLLSPSHQPKKPLTFFEGSLPSIPTQSAVPCVIELICKNGSTVKISGLQPLQIQPLISLFIGA